MSKLIDYAQGVVLPDLTDEALNNKDGFYQSDVRELLLKIPADQRQNVLAEKSRRSTVSERVYDRHSGRTETQCRRIRDGVEVMKEIMLENGWTP